MDAEDLDRVRDLRLQAHVDQVSASIRDNRLALHVLYPDADEPCHLPAMYTTGLTHDGLPELLPSATPVEAGARVLIAMAAIARTDPRAVAEGTIIAMGGTLYRATAIRGPLSRTWPILASLYPGGFAITLLDELGPTPHQTSTIFIDPK